MGQNLRFDRDMPFTHEPWVAARDRYEHLEYRRVGDSGLLLPPMAVGLWYNFGDNKPFATQREVLRHAFDKGITHFDLANNYGPPQGSAEENFGRMLRGDFKPYRNELIVSTKAGWDMWPGPYGNLGSRKYMLASLDESLQRLSTDYVDIYYSHRADHDTPVEETIGALDTAVRQGKALYVGISSYSAERTQQAIDVARRLGTPLVIHQPAYNLFNRWVEGGLLATLRSNGLGSIAFTALAQGMLTGKYLGSGSPERATDRPSFDENKVTPEVKRRLEGLNEIAAERGQTLAQLALSWVLCEGGATSTLIGVSSTKQIDENLAALDKLEFTDDELARIDEFAAEADINQWSVSSDK